MKKKILKIYLVFFVLSQCEHSKYVHFYKIIVDLLQNLYENLDTKLDKKST